MAYTIYWAPTLSDSLTPFITLEGTSESVYVFNEAGEIGSIAGCFVVTALDSLMEGPEGLLRRNESAFSDTLCADNCPFYFLPNVFTPNGDQSNDAFVAFPWKFIERVDFRVHNRNGEEVFQTEDPDIQWDGTHRDGGLCADGLYYYTAKVFTIRLEGLVEESFTGTIQLLDGRPLNPE
jgi:gliding motility-associated-like protein